MSAERYEALIDEVTDICGSRAVTRIAVSVVLHAAAGWVEAEGDEHPGDGHSYRVAAELLRESVPMKATLPGSLQTPLWHTLPDDAELLATLIAATCPAPCIGRRDAAGEDWHAGCEQRASEALRILRGWSELIAS